MVIGVQMLLEGIGRLPGSPGMGKRFAVVTGLIVMFVAALYALAALNAYWH
jgi:hypothetical protein